MCGGYRNEGFTAANAMLQFWKTTIFPRSQISPSNNAPDTHTGSSKQQPQRLDEEEVTVMQTLCSTDTDLDE